MSDHWYSRYPGDYGRDTAHLSMIEHGAYTLLLDHYYSIAGPLPADAPALYRICRAFEETERQAVDSVLHQFFSRQSDGYHNSRADLELLKRAEQHDRLSKSGKRGAKKRWDGQAIGQAIASPPPQPQKKERKSAAKPPADPRYGPFLEFAKSAYTLKHGEPPTWDCFGKDGAALAAFLRRAPHVTPEEWQTRLSHYFDSTEAFTLKRGGSLSYFVSEFDAFKSGPILEHPGGTHGKQSASDLATKNARALGFVQ